MLQFGCFRRLGYREGRYKELAVEYTNLLFESGQTEECFRFVKELPDGMKCLGLIQLTVAELALLEGDLAKAEKILNKVEIPNIRESETDITDTWFELQALKLAKYKGHIINDGLGAETRIHCKPPKRIDFTMF